MSILYKQGLIKKLFILLLIMNISLVAGCIFDNDKDNDSKELTLADYVPLISGATYQYNSTKSWPTLEIPSEFSSYTGVIADTVEIDGKTYYPVHDYLALWIGNIDTTLFRIADNTMYMLKTYHNYEGEKMSDVPLIDFKKASWDIFNYSESSWLVPNKQTTWTGKNTGIETISVPAGTFENCQVFEISILEVFSDAENEEIIVDFLERKIKLWCAAHVGWVKLTLSFEVPDINDLIKTEYLDVVELTSYSIPNDK